MAQGEPILTAAACGGNLPGNVPGSCHRRIREIVDYWRRIHPASGLPGRQHFDPLDVPALLPSIRLLDVVGRPPRFRVRLMGTRLRDLFGAELTGRWLDEIFPNLEGSVTHIELLKTLENKEPRWRRGKPALDVQKDFLDMERVYLPFARDGRNIDLILTYQLCIDSKGNYW